MTKIRADHALPECMAAWGWKYHHLGIPTEEKRPGETYLPHLKVYVSGFKTSPFGIEWMRFEKGCPVPLLIRTVPHVAFEVKDIMKTLSENHFTILSSPNSPSPGITVAMIEHNGAPIELIEFEKS